MLDAITAGVALKGVSTVPVDSIKATGNNASALMDQLRSGVKLKAVPADQGVLLLGSLVHESTIALSSTFERTCHDNIEP